jgi:hypothetical protein
MTKLGVAALLAVALVASAEARVSLRKPGRGIQMRMKKFVVPPGGEREVCEFRVMPNRKPFDVQAFELNMTPGSHHFVLWEYLGVNHDPSAFPKELVDSPGCIGVGPRDSFVANANLFGMQTARGRVRFPSDVAVRLQPRAYVLLNFHIRNPSLTEPLTAEAVFNLRPARKGTVRHRAQTLTVGNSADIRIPPLGTQTITSDWHAPADMNVVQLSTHQHKRGTHVDIRLIDDAGNDLGPLFEAGDWEHPGERWFDPAFRLAKGQGIRFTCGWTNPDDRMVTFGVTTNDEMCFATGYFYPDDENTSVIGPGCIPQAEGLLCFTRKVN